MRATAEFFFLWLGQYWMTQEFVLPSPSSAHHIINKIGVRRLPELIPHGDVVATDHNAITLLIDLFVANGRNSCFFVAFRNTLLPKLIFGKIRFQVSAKFVEARSWRKFCYPVRTGKRAFRWSTSGPWRRGPDSKPRYRHLTGIASIYRTRRVARTVRLSTCN